jgi:hypothetical protein
VRSYFKGKQKNLNKRARIQNTCYDENSVLRWESYTCLVSFAIHRVSFVSSNCRMNAKKRKTRKKYIFLSTLRRILFVEPRENLCAEPVQNMKIKFKYSAIFIIVIIIIYYYFLWYGTRFLQWKRGWVLLWNFPASG